ncbi:hypothetical protein F5Y16DRAFT_125932 [Xylariaceae sp. FL0255]|nr:hypothetical protein F5Y16DRAFT_125932 [Xylariaceae sp. FL0255]
MLSDTKTGRFLMDDSPETDMTSPPKRRVLPGGMDLDDDNDTSMESPYVSEVVAPRACEKCRASKRKCDKKLPCCDRCKRLNAKCHYLQDPSFNNGNPYGPQVVFVQSHSLSSDVLFRGTEPLEGITVPQILSLVSWDQAPAGAPHDDWRRSVSLYFECIHSWFAAVHPSFFYRRAHALLQVASETQGGGGNPSETPESPPFSQSSRDDQVSAHQSSVSHNGSVAAHESLAMKETALLVVLMHLNIRMRLTSAGEECMFDETYRTVKRMFSMLLISCAGGPKPTIELVQCGALMALYEYGHGDIETAYQTLNHTAATGRILGLAPVQRGDENAQPMSLEEEQRNCLWWGLFILEQFVLQESVTRHLPFVLDKPAQNTILPETPPATPAASIMDHDSPGMPLSPPASAMGTTSLRLLATEIRTGKQLLASFQLSAKAASIFHSTLEIDKERRKQNGKLPLVSTYYALDQEIRNSTQTLLNECQDWEMKLDCFAMLISSLFMLYLPYLQIIERTTPAAIAADPELTVALTALRFACKMSTDISCKINMDFSTGRSPAILCAPVGATCYLVIVAFSTLCRIFPDENVHCQEAIREKFESLWLFSFRWGIAEKMMTQLEFETGLNRHHYLQQTKIALLPHASSYSW